MEPTDEEKKAMEAPPKGAFVMMTIYTVLAVVGWFAFYYGIFIPRGPVN